MTDPSQHTTGQYRRLCQQPISTRYSVDAATYGNYPGLYYPVNRTTGYANGSVAINAKDPSISVDVWDINTSRIVTGASVIQGDALTFRIQTNLNEV